MASDSLTNFAVLLNRRFRRDEFPFCQHILLHHAGAVYCCLWKKRQVASDPRHELVHGSGPACVLVGGFFWAHDKEKNDEKRTYYFKKQCCSFDC